MRRLALVLLLAALAAVSFFCVMQTAQNSFATAVGLFNSVVNFIILVTANFIAKKVSDISIF